MSPTIQLVLGFIVLLLPIVIPGLLAFRHTPKDADYSNITLTPGQRLVGCLPIRLLMIPFIAAPFLLWSGYDQANYLMLAGGLLCDLLGGLAFYVFLKSQRVQRFRLEAAYARQDYQTLLFEQREINL